MLKNGVDQIYVSVGKMDASLPYYRDYIGMRAVAEKTFDARTLEDLWQVPEGTTADSVILRHGACETLLILMEFRPSTVDTIRQGAAQWDYGYYDIGFRVDDGEAIHADLVQKGYRSVSPPVFVNPDWRPFTFKEFVLYGPDDVMITHIQIDSQEKTSFDRRYGLLMHTCWFVEDMDLAFEFYGKLLGQTIVTDHHMPEGLVDDILTLPPGSHLRMGYLGAAFSSTGQTQKAGLELLEASVKGRLLDAAPPRRGQFANAFETEDLDRLLERLAGTGARVLSGVVELDLPERGSIRAVNVMDPCGIRVLFFQRHS
jgi:catechol 2,3-dioxygenase-like lactoylglutathione lyase family enzyme